MTETQIPPVPLAPGASPASGLIPGWYTNDAGIRRYWDGSTWLVADWTAAVEAHAAEQKAPTVTPMRIPAVPTDAAPTIPRRLPRPLRGVADVIGPAPLWLKIAASLVVLVLVAGLVWIFGVALPAASLANQIRDAKASSVAMCKSLVSAQLRSPATAQFGDFTPVDLKTSAEATIAKNGGETYTMPVEKVAKVYIMHSTVDSQNGFGAMLRSNVNCIIGIENGRATSKDAIALVTDASDDSTD